MNRPTFLLGACLALAGFGAAAAPAGPSAAATAVTVPPAAGYGARWQLSQGFILHAEDRFDPLIQRIMAEQSLKALPLRGGQLFYIVPVHADPRLEEMQIRYLELLLDRQDVEPDAAGP